MKEKKPEKHVDSTLIPELYNKLLDEFGKQNWWPAETPFEVIVGALLTQQTRWQNVEEAIKNLKEKGLMDAESIASADEDLLEELIFLHRILPPESQTTKRYITFFLRKQYGRSVFSSPE